MRRYALTGKEVVSILMQRLIKVDGKVRRSGSGVGGGAHEPCLGARGRWTGCAGILVVLAALGAACWGRVTARQPA